MKFEYIGTHPMRILLITVILLLGGCSNKDRSVSNLHRESQNESLPASNVPVASSSVPIELALQDGARLEASTDNSNVAVIAGDKLKRRYEWDGCGLDANMIPRQERWFGSLGMYDPAGRLSIDPNAGCHGISRPVVQEGQIHFADKKAAEVWISRNTLATLYKTVWTNDGLFIRWSINPQRYQINVDLWQICIEGKKPTELAGALDNAIKVSHPKGSEFARRDCVNVSERVIIETQKTLDDNWRQIDEYIGNTKH